MIHPRAAKIYQNIAATRRALADNPDLTTAELREMLGSALTACELLNQATDVLTETLETFAIARGITPP